MAASTCWSMRCRSITHFIRAYQADASGNLRVPAVAAQLQPDHGDGGARHGGRGSRRGHSADRRHRPRRRAYRGGLCAPWWSKIAAAARRVGGRSVQGASRDERESKGAYPPADVRPAGHGIRRRLDRQSRYRHPDPVLEFRFRRQGDHLPFRERGDRLRPTRGTGQRGSAPRQRRRVST